MRTWSGTSDEWCLVEDDCHAIKAKETVQRQPEHEPVPEILRPKKPVKENQEDEEEEIVVLLPDMSDDVPIHSRESMLSLLTPDHRRHVLKVSASPCKRRPVRRAFERLHPAPYPTRLRNLIQSFADVELTPIEPFAIGTSVEDIEIDWKAPQDMRENLSDAISRSLTLQLQLSSKTQACELLEVRNLRLKVSCERHKKQTDCLEFKSKRLERSLALAQSRETLTSDYGTHLKAELDHLRQENQRLQQQSRVLSNDKSLLHHLSHKRVEELEMLEASLVSGTEAVRAALRTKYREAMQAKHEKLCLICCAKPVAVVLMPCAHQVLCAHCALRVTQCPIDRKEIQDKVLTFGLNAYASSS